MNRLPLGRVLDDLQRTIGHADAHVSDARLLELFIRQGDGHAFAALLHRHGPMVLGVCQRILGNRDDAEDAFQATFLVLVRKARTLRTDGGHDRASERAKPGQQEHAPKGHDDHRGRQQADPRREPPALRDLPVDGGRGEPEQQENGRFAAFRHATITSITLRVLTLLVA